MSKNIHTPYSFPSGIFITGTDTNVGKTVLTTALSLALQEQGIQVGLMKPVETGRSPSFQDSDSARLRHSLQPNTPPPIRNSYQFPDPIAPLSASKRIQQSIDLDRIKTHYEEIRGKCEIILVEGAGGVLVPLTDQFNVRDLIAFLELPTIIVTKNTLGAVNHTLLTIEALRRKDIPILAIMLNQSTPLTGKEIEKIQMDSTTQLIREYSGIQVFGPLLFSPLIQNHWEKGILEITQDTEIRKLVTFLRKTS
ncbi:MAG: dethiobiotin synthase [Nitrospirota bacterium]|nr:dethiobiotin synthase [Nitrospirota bacterium]